jgi:hypothetical protein
MNNCQACKAACDYANKYGIKTPKCKNINFRLVLVIWKKR